MTNKLPDIQEEPDILKLKEKLQSISNPYYIAPYDSLQLYHYEVSIQFFGRLKVDGPGGRSFKLWAIQFDNCPTYLVDLS